MKFYGNVILGSILLLLISHSLWADDNPLLAYVPADTILFSGNTEQVNLSDYPLLSLSLTPQEVLSQAEKQALGPSGHFFYELYADLQQTLHASNTYQGSSEDSSVFKNHYGLSQKLAVVFYTQGLSPVIKLRLENEQSLLKIFDQASSTSGLSFQVKQYKQQSYRSYAIADKFQLIVSSLILFLSRS